jgi:hypothetical protein
MTGEKNFITRQCDIFLLTFMSFPEITGKLIFFLVQNKNGSYTKRDGGTGTLSQ